MWCVCGVLSYAGILHGNFSCFVVSSFLSVRPSPTLYNFLMFISNYVSGVARVFFIMLLSIYVFRNQDECFCWGKQNLSIHRTRRPAYESHNSASSRDT